MFYANKLEYDRKKCTEILSYLAGKRNKKLCLPPSQISGSFLREK
jgi:hypothetical protein